MKRLGVIFVFLLLVFVWLVYSEKITLNTNRTSPQTFSGEILSGEVRGVIVNNTPNVNTGVTLSGQHLSEMNTKFSAFRSNDASYSEIYSTYINNKSYFNGLIEGGSDDLYKNNGIDIYPSLFYLCLIIEGSKDEDELKKKMIKGRKIILLSTSYSGAIEAYGGENLITDYNQSINRYILEGAVGYKEFYKGLQVSAQAIYSANSSPQVKSIGEVVVAIYGLGNQKFVDGKSVNCAKDMEPLLSGKNLNP